MDPFFPLVWKPDLKTDKNVFFSAVHHLKSISYSRHLFEL